MRLTKYLNKATLSVSGFVASLLMSTNVHAASNGLIAYPCRIAGFQNICTIDPNNPLARPVQITSGDHNGVPSWSPTGKMLAYTNVDSLGNYSIVVMNAQPGSLKSSIADGLFPAWSRDGKEIAFTSLSTGTPEIWVMRPDGTKQRQLTDDRRFNNQLPTWSPDGKSIAYTQRNPMALNPSVWVITSSGKNPRQLTTGTCDLGPPPVPCSNVDADGTFINFASEAGSPAWSPISNQIILGVRYVNPIIFWSGVEREGGQIWIIDADGNNRKQLTKPVPAVTQFGINNDDPEWSPDGTKIVFSTNRNNGNNEMWVMNADGSDQNFIVENTAGPFPGDAAWQPIP